MVDLTTAVSDAFCNKLISGLLNEPFLVRSYETIPNIFHPQVQFYANQTYFKTGYSKRTSLFESLITPCKSKTILLILTVLRFASFCCNN